MKLDRNINGTGRGKYGLIKNRKLQEILTAGEAARRQYADLQTAIPDPELAKITSCFQHSSEVEIAIDILEKAGILDWGDEGTEGEFFVIKLRDRYAKDALAGYSRAALFGGDEDLYRDVRDLTDRSGQLSPFCKKPD